MELSGRKKVVDRFLAQGQSALTDVLLVEEDPPLTVEEVLGVVDIVWQLIEDARATLHKAPAELEACPGCAQLSRLLPVFDGTCYTCYIEAA